MNAKKDLQTWGKSLYPILIVSLLLAFGCIPIEDKINPEISVGELRPIYYYQDTLHFSLFLFDNSNTDSVHLTIGKMGVEVDGLPPWEYADSMRVEGRRVEPSFEIVVPEYKQTGNYLLTAYGFDEGGNVDTLQRLFQLEADNTPPVFESLTLGLQQNAEGQYIACRSEVLSIRGGVADNLHLKRLGFSLGEAAGNLIRVAADSMSIGQFLSDKVSIPTNIPDGSLLNFTIIAEDTFQNRSSHTFPILVNCDDRSPELTYMSSTPKLNNNFRASLRKGQVWQLSELMVADNRQVTSVSVFFNKKGRNLQPFAELQTESAGPFNLADSLPLNFTIPDNAFAGEIYEVSISAQDSAGNISPFFRAELQVVEDLPPSIIVTDTYRNEEWLRFAEDDYVAVRRGDYLSFDGKIDEDFQLVWLRYYWHQEGNTPEPHLEQSNFTQYPINLRNTYPEKAFRVPTNATLGSRWLLKIEAWDGQNQSVSRVYRFEVE